MAENEPTVKVMSKDEVEQMFKDIIAREAPNVDLSTDHNKGVLKDIIQEALKQYPVEKKTPFDTGEVDKKGGFTDIGDFAYNVVKSGQNCSVPTEKMRKWFETADNVQKAAGSPTQQISTLSDGGALIPPEFSTEVLTRVMARSAILGKVRVMPMNSDVLYIPGVVDDDRSQGKAGGIKFYPVAELSTPTATKINLESTKLELRQFAALVYASDKVLDFAPALRALINPQIEDAMYLSMADWFVNGTGAGQPLGVIGCGAEVSVAKETGQAADTIDANNVAKAFARLEGNSAEWFCSKTIFPQLFKMSIPVGTGGAPIFIMNVSQTAPGSLLGYPVNYEEVMPVLGDKGDLLLADFSKYMIGQRTAGAGLQVAESMHLKFDYFQTTFRFSFYLDGRPTVNVPLKPRRGNTLSPFVNIAARA